MPGMFDAVWVGVREVEAAFTKVAADADAVAVSALQKVGADVVKRAMNDFSGSHAKGERHVGGAMPNIVTGNLRRSIHMEKPERLGVGDWKIMVGFGTVYGMAIEFGNPRTGAPAYPFFTPAVEASQPSWAGTMASEWSRIVI